jgi:phosphopantothenate-cysteine ligase
LERYGHQIVIGNILSTRKNIVTLFTRDTAKKDALSVAAFKIALTDQQIADGIEIESLIVPELIRRHKLWMEIV